MANNKLKHATGGFTAIPNSVIELVAVRTINVNGLLLYTYLTYRINNERQVAFPSYTKIAEDLHIGRRTISETLKQLEEAKLITKCKRFGNSTEYTVQVPTPVVPGENHSSSKVELSVVPGRNCTNNEFTKNETTNISSSKADEDIKPSPSKKKSTDPRVKSLLEAFTELVGYPLPNYGQEGKAAKQMFRDGYEQEDILACWGEMQKEPFWNGKHISLTSVNKTIGAWLKTRTERDRASPAAAPDEIIRTIEPDFVKG